MVQTFSEIADNLTCRSDRGLAAEISAPMVSKLKHDGWQRGFQFALLLTLGGFAWSFADLAAYRELGGPDPTGKFLLMLVASPILIIFLPMYSARRSVWAEVHYRRRTGKWRWEI